MLAWLILFIEIFFVEVVTETSEASFVIISRHNIRLDVVFYFNNSKEFLSRHHLALRAYLFLDLI